MDSQAPQRQQGGKPSARDGVTPSTSYIRSRPHGGESLFRWNCWKLGPYAECEWPWTTHRRRAVIVVLSNRIWWVDGGDAPLLHAVRALPPRIKKQEKIKPRDVAFNLVPRPGETRLVSSGQARSTRGGSVIINQTVSRFCIRFCAKISRFQPKLIIEFALDFM